MCDLLRNNRAPRLRFLFPLGVYDRLVSFLGVNKPLPFGSQFWNGVLFLLVYWFDAARPLLLSFGSVDSLNITSVWEQRSTRLLFILLLRAFSPGHEVGCNTTIFICDQVLNANASCVWKFNGYYMFDFPPLRLMSDS